MRKLLPFITLLLIFTACKNNDTDYKAELEGQWVCNEIDYLFIPTNEQFVIDFSSNDKLTLSQVYSLDAGNSWLSSSNYTYKVEEDVVHIKGTNPLGQSVDLSMKIKRVGSNYLDYQETKSVINNQDVSGSRIFSLYRKEDITAGKFTGEWEFHQVAHADSVYSLHYKIDFKSNGSCEKFYYEEGNWRKDDNIYNYLTCGDLLILNIEDVSYTFPIYSCECYTISNTSSESISLSSLARIPGGNNLKESKFKLIRL